MRALLAFPFQEKKQQHKLILPRRVWYMMVSCWQKSGFQGKELQPSLCRNKDYVELEVLLFLQLCMILLRATATIPVLKPKKVGSFSPSHSAVNMQSFWLDTRGICVWYKLMCTYDIRYFRRLSYQPHSNTLDCEQLYYSPCGNLSTSSLALL